MTRATSTQRAFAAALTNLAKRIHDGYEPANGIDANDRPYERTGYLMIRAGLITLTEGDRARRLAADWSARGYPAGGNDPGRGTSDTTSVEAASTTTDEWERTVELLDQHRWLLDTHAAAIEHAIANTIRVVPPDQRRSKLLTDTALDLDCANPHCDNKITGIGDDRPRRGRCPRCYKFLTRNGRDWTPRAESCPHPKTAGHHVNG